ncbi:MULTISPECIES: MarR family winged helix-turn-helix transcriptional regulator [unclassified Streptomyces]|uniref:MarR family winged helix-turn-helix transcriptional regulator n=1 Tax=unclassified Streptomyces TaxID=2593676 RepID=UPI00362F8CCF
MAEDLIAGVMRQWQQVLPELDTAPMAVIGRLHRCSALLQRATDAPLGRERLTRPEFDILGTLRRTDRELTPGRIARETFASGAAVTKRLRRLEKRGLVARRPDDRDRRVTHMSLTAEGRELLDRLLPEQLGYEAALLDGLGTRGQERLAGSLGELLVVLEGRLGSLPDS